MLRDRRRRKTHNFSGQSPGGSFLVDHLHRHAAAEDDVLAGHEAGRGEELTGLGDVLGPARPMPCPPPVMAMIFIVALRRLCLNEIIRDIKRRCFAI
jgi:hypothetical protein